MNTQLQQPASFPEPPEPRAEKGFMPVSLIGLLAVLGFLGNMYFIYHGLDIGGEGGAFPKLVYFPYGSYAQIPQPEGGGKELGKRIYNGPYCAPCHQPSGMGTPGTFPPLAGSEWVTAEGPGRIIRIVLNGLTGPIEVAGQQYNNTMLPWRDTLKDEEIAAVLTFIRSEWGNKAPPVTPDQVAKVREATKGRATPWTVDELKQVPDNAE